MSANICNICGANLIYKDGKWVCPACGAFKTEEISNEEVTLLYNAAQKLRLASFDDAEEAYRDIIAKYPENSEAHWGLVLSKYGIKYEDDYDGKKLPTCYATSIESVLTDKDYLDAVRLCKDKYQKEYYIEQGKVLEKIRVEWLEKASKEPKYDVFLCFKDSDKLNNMERTDDSIEVANLYTHLSSLGYKVFYSRESLRDKVAEKYEPYIYNALNTAAVMIIYGSKIEYFSSVWMKNEWTRYVRRLREGLKIEGSLVIACDGVNPGDLPRPLNQMQVLDARKKTFYGDLETHIAKIISIARRPKATVERIEISSAIGKKKASIDNQIKTIKVGGGVGKKTPVVIDNAVSVREIGRYEVPALTPDEDTKLKSINLFLQKELFDNAKKVVDEILEKNKYNGQALLADLLIRYKVKSIDELSDKIEEIEDFSQFNTVIEYNDKDVGEKLIAVIGQKIRLAVANSNYDVAIACLKEIVVYNSTEVLNIRLELRKTATRLLAVSANTAAEIFDVLVNSYQDSETYIEYIQGFVDDCIKNRQFTVAQKYNNKIIELDDGNLKATFSQAYIYVQATSFDNFITLADRFVDFKLFDNAIKHFDEDDTVECFARFRKIVVGLIVAQKSGNAIADWFDFVVKYEFDGRNEFIEETINSLPDIKDLTDRAKLFDRAIMCIDGSDVERHISMRLSFAKKLQVAGNFALANKYYNEVIEIEEGNLDALWGIILCYIGALRETDIAQNIENFSYFKEFETLLKYCPDMGIRAEYLDKLVNAVLFKSASICNEESINKLAKIFDGIIKYYPEECNEILIKHLQKFADNCKNSSAFSLAEKYYAMVLAIDNMKHEAYWGLLQAKLNCRNNDDLIKQHKKIADLEDFSSVIAASASDERAADRYASIAKKQIDYQEEQRRSAAARKRKKRQVRILSLLAVFVAVIALSIFSGIGYYKTESALKYVENETGYTVFGGKYFKETNVIIPAEYNGKQVTKIDDNAFSGNTHIETITLPATIIEIGNRAFKDCVSLKLLRFDFNKNTAQNDIIALALKNENGEINATNLKKIGVEAFYNCKSLETIDLQGIEIIDARAFYGCAKLRSVTIPETIQSVGERVFAKCDTLQKIIIEGAKDDLTGFADDWKDGLSQNVKITAGFKVKILNEKGEIIDSVVVEYGEEYVISPINRDGYTFLGWILNPTEKLTNEKGESLQPYNYKHAITVQAQWEANVNSIIFEANSGVGAMENQRIATDGTAKLNKCIFTRVGYTFIGWGTTSTEKVYDDASDYKMGTKSQYRLFAIWQANTNTLHFNANGGTGDMENAYIRTDDSATLPRNLFEKKGYDFVGWAESAEGKVVYADQSVYQMDVYAENVLYAQWIPAKYIITYNLNYGKIAGNNPKEYTIETQTFILNNPTREGYIFSGWSGTEIIGEQDMVTIEIGSIGNRLYEAHWIANLNTLHFDSNGGTGSMEDMKIQTDETVRLSACMFTKRGYSFAGWAMSATSEKIYSEEAVYKMGVKSEYTLYAKWNLVYYTITYFLNNGIGTTNPNQYTVESNDFILNNPVREGYAFIGWSGTDLIEQSTKVIVEKGSIGNRAFTANWKANNNTVEFDANGGMGSMNSQTIQTGASDILYKCAFSKKGYTFSGWAISKNGEKIYNDCAQYKMGTASKYILYAVWSANLNTLYFDGNTSDSGDMSSLKVYSDETIVLPKNKFEKTGYSFVGWAETASGDIIVTDTEKYVMPCEEGVTLYAVWKAIPYTITLDACGKSLKSTQAKIGFDSDFQLEVPENIDLGFEFIGWYSSDFTIAYTDKQGKSITKWSYAGNDKVLYAKYAIKDEMNNFIFRSTVNTCIITGVYNKEITDIFIPDYVTEIISGAFEVCRNVQTLDLPFAGRYKDGGWLYDYEKCIGVIFGTNFYYNDEYEYDYYKWEATGAMYVKFKIPDTLTHIILRDGTMVPYLFAGCSGVETFEIPISMTELADFVFKNCSSLKTYSIPKQINKLGSYIFDNCNALTKVILSENIFDISEGTFYGCSNLTYNIFDNAMFIGSVKRPHQILVKALNTTIIKSEIPQDVEFIHSQAFYQCKSLQVISVPYGVKSLGYKSFAECTMLTEISIPQSIIYIGADAFEYCPIETADIPSIAIEFIEKSHLKNIVVNSGNIADSAFANCNRLVSVIINSEVTSIGYEAFKWCGALKEVTIGNGILCIAESTFIGCNSIEKMTLPFVGKSRTALKEEAVLGYIFGFTVVHTEKATIASASFLNTKSFDVNAVNCSRNQNIPTGLTAQYGYFYNSGEATSISGKYWGNTTVYYYNIPQTLKKVIITDCENISKGAFLNCSMIQKLALESAIISIDDFAFCECSNLQTLTICSTSVPKVTINSLGGLSSTNVYVPAELLDAYHSDELWNKCTIIAVQ